MSIIRPPLLRERLRSVKEIADEVTGCLEEQGFAPMGTDPLRDGLVQIFARYGQMLSERLNRIPESHQHDFLNLLSARPTAAIPARVPLSFKVVESAQLITAIVPKFTEISGAVENGSEAVIFETQKDLPLVQAELKQVIAAETRRLVQADVSEIASCAPAGSVKPYLFTDPVPLKRALHISQPEIIGVKKLNSVRIKIDLEQETKIPRGFEIEWAIRSETEFSKLEPESDTTNGLTRSGELVFIPPEEYPSSTILDCNVAWLTCSLRPSDLLQLAANTSTEYSGSITGIEISGSTLAAAVPATSAYNGSIPLDVSRDFFPLGERPRFGEVFYILSESFALPEARIVIDLKLTNPAGVTDSPIRPVSRKGTPRLRWETYTTRGWLPVNGIDGTGSLTQDGKIELLTPNDARPTTINAVTGGWLRAVLVGGNYVADNSPESPASINQATPPSVATMQLTSIKEFGPLKPHLVIESGLEYHDLDAALPFNPFPAPGQLGLMLYLGFSGKPAALVGRSLSLYAVPCPGTRRAFCRDGDAGTTRDALPRWHAYTSSGWRECAVTDSTRGLHDPGIIELQMPGDIAEWRNSTVDPKRVLRWVRIAWDNLSASSNRCTDELACPQRLLLNTVLASQTSRLTDELLGSSNARPKQTFYSLRRPVIGEMKLQVREPRGLADKVLNPSSTYSSEKISQSSSSFDISSFSTSEWITWSEVENFSSSGSGARHYVVDRLTGRISFGDGRNGLIPPAGGNNIRVQEYHTGGGSHGNQPAGRIEKLLTTIPYVESVTNAEPAAGGQEQENQDALSKGAIAQVRHRDRAVCIDDYADLARRASPEIAYATCAPTRDLVRVPELDNETIPGIVSVIIVPYSSKPRPQPSLELLRNVKAFLDSRRPVSMDLVVIGPEYVRTDVVADIAWKSDYSKTNAVVECKKRLDRFLHSVTGGAEENGWRFGQLPHASDIYPVLAGIEGLDDIRSLELRHEEDRPGLLSTRMFLICPGEHEIRIC
jgi:hypothetical protein